MLVLSYLALVIATIFGYLFLKGKGYSAPLDTILARLAIFIVAAMAWLGMVLVGVLKILVLLFAYSIGYFFTKMRYLRNRIRSALRF